MLTFFVNPDMNKDKICKVAKLINQCNAYNRDELGIAYINIVCNVFKNDEDGRKVNLSSVHYFRKVNEKIKSEQSCVQHLEGMAEDIDEDKRTIVEPVLFEDELVEKMDFEYDCKAIVEWFIKRREEVFFDRGSDIWRLLTLARMGDVIASNKLREIFVEAEDKELLSRLILDNRIFAELEKILN